MSQAFVSAKGDIDLIMKQRRGGPVRGNAVWSAGKVRLWEWGFLAAILVLALILRIVGLDAPLWYDEVLTLTHFVREPWGVLVQDFSSLNNHMFYSLQAKASLALFGESAWSLRAPALVFGMGSLVVLWFMAREATGRRAALIATFLTAISYHHVWFTQNARGYTGLMFWTALATLFLVMNLRKPGWKTSIAYALAVAAGMYTHLTAGFFFAVHAIVYLAAVGLDRGGAQIHAYPGLRDIRPFAAFALSGVLTLILHLPILSQIGGAMGEVSGDVSNVMSEWQSPLRTLQEVIASLGPLGPVAPLAFAGGVALILIGAGVILRRSPILGAIYLLQVPVTLSLLLALDFRIWPRYFFVDIGFAFMCVAAGIVAASAWFEPLLKPSGAARLSRAAPTIAMAAAVVVATLASGVLLMKNYRSPKQDFVGAVAEVEALRQSGDVAVATGLAAEPVHGYYAPEWPTVTHADELAGLEAPGRTVYVVTAFASHLERRHPDIAERLKTEYELVDRLEGTLAGGSVRIYRSKAS